MPNSIDFTARGMAQSALSQTADIANYKNGLFTTDKLRSILKTGKKLLLIGDSISEGSNTGDFQNDGFGGIIRKAFQLEYDTLNYGFENLREGVNDCNRIHSLTNSGFTITLDDTYYGGTKASSITQDAFLQLDFTGKNIQVVYARRADGGVLDLEYDGVVLGQLYTVTANPGAKFSVGGITTNSGVKYGSHTLKLIKKDTNPTDILGIYYYEDNTNLPRSMFSNLGCSSVRLSRLEDAVIDYYCTDNAVILALGVNDFHHSETLATFKAKLGRFASNLSTNKGYLLVCDFMFDANQDSTYEPIGKASVYKNAIKEVMADYPEFEVLDFADLWYGDNTANIAYGLLDADAVHPTALGHESIANILLRHIGMPYHKTSLVGKSIERTVEYSPAYATGWTDFGTAGFKTTKIYKQGSKVWFEGFSVKSAGTTLIMTLPTELRPATELFFPCDAGHAYGNIQIKANGEVKLYAGDGTNYVSFYGISYTV
jgi:hypothetical protein